MSNIVNNLRNREPSEVGNEAAACEIGRLQQELAQAQTDMNLFIKHKSVHDSVWAQMLNTTDPVKLLYWTNHYYRLWRLCLNGKQKI